jgi:hypothetical protein
MAIDSETMTVPKQDEFTIFTHNDISHFHPQQMTLSYTCNLHCVKQCYLLTLTVRFTSVEVILTLLCDASYAMLLHNECFLFCVLKMIIIGSEYLTLKHEQFIILFLLVVIKKGIDIDNHPH